jgi:RIO-like serine/threonine protein kinase
MCIGSGRHDGNADLSPHNIIYNIDTDQFTIIDFESLEPWQHWYNKDDYVSFVFGGMIRLLDFFRRHNDIFNFISNKDYPELLNYCFQYIDKEIV